MSSILLAREELEFGKTLAAHPEPCFCPLQLSQIRQSTHFTGPRKQWAKPGPMGRVHCTFITDRI